MFVGKQKLLMMLNIMILESQGKCKVLAQLVDNEMKT